MLHIAVRVARIPFGMAFDQRIIPCGVVGDPIDDHFHAHALRGVHEGLEVLQCAKLGVDAEIIFDRIGAAQRAFALFFANRVDRHQPENIHAQIFDPGQVFAHRVKGPGV